jgi:hypothetical protein
MDVQSSKLLVSDASDSFAFVQLLHGPNNATRMS